MITYEEALRLLAEHIRPLGTETVALDRLLGHVLAQDVTAKCDMPRFDNSAVDGYALSAEDFATMQRGEVTLDLAGTVRAGEATCSLRPGETVQVFTGAPIPEGTAAVVMQEDAQQSEGRIRLTGHVREGQHVRRRGEEFREGDVVVPSGRRATPAVVGAVASAGRHSVMVNRRPRVGVLVTGNELVLPGETLRDGAIYDSNTPLLLSLLRSVGIQDALPMRCGDDRNATRAALEKLLAECDAVITSGGVSVGAYDVVRLALAALGVQEVFWRVAIKPGKPVYFGVATSDSPKYVFGLPGNPLSVAATFLTLVVPALGALESGVVRNPFTLHARLAVPVQKKAGRLEFVPCMLRGDRLLTAQPIAERGSHMLGGFARANALFLFPLDCDTLQEADEVVVSMLPWGVIE
ncbi:MAG: molybdopterin molybdenumtransferase MoeA [Fimbriimonadales bacterium]